MKKIPVAPINVVFVQIKKKVYDTRTFASGITLYKDTTFHPEEASMCEATIVSLPRAIQDRYDYRGMTRDGGGKLHIGDTILIRYDVVFHYHHQPDRDNPIYKNILLYEGQEYWRVDIQQIFGVLRKGSVEMVNGYIMCDPVKIDINMVILHTAEHFSWKLSNELFRIRYVGEALAGEPLLDLKAGDRVHTRPGIAQNYQTDWGDFSIIKQSHVLAIENMA